MHFMTSSNLGSFILFLYPYLSYSAPKPRTHFTLELASRELIYSVLYRANASSDPSSVVQGFLNSLGGGQSQSESQAQDPFTTLQDLLTPASTLPFVEAADDKTIDNLLSYLPPSLLLLASDVEDVSGEDSEVAEAVMLSLDISQKKDILRKVLHSPQFTQSLASLTVALRDGGLPSISEALKIPVENRGFLRRGGVPLGGGDAVKAFLEGAKGLVKGQDRMETD